MISNTQKIRIALASLQTEKLLSPDELNDRLIRFNETNDWSVFDDVPPSQYVNVMYPHMTEAALKQAKERRK